MTMQAAARLTAARRRGLALVAGAYAVALAAAVAAGWALRGHHPILVAAAADVVATAVVFAFSVALDNSSMYDAYWSVAPIPIALFWASTAGGAAAVRVRQAAAIVLVCVWGVRLTGNWVARWRGLHDEDFRYVEIRGRTGRAYWPASFVAIHLMPTIWVFLGLLPLYAALATPGRPLGPLDAAAAALAAAAIAIEATADRQLRAFLRARRDPADVLDTGLWGLSRHPNYFGEVLFWWALYFFGVAANRSWAWTFVGPLSITVLFVLVSVPWMDRRMLSRHPAWAERMRTTPALVPWPRRTR
jgi:steroid 5-alpha reductase family enzyme